MYGADADELERLAAQFRRTADELDGEGNALTGVLNRVLWLGDLATRYLDNWTGVQIPKIGLSTQFLRDAALELDANAREQRATSQANAGVLSPIKSSSSNDKRSNGVWKELDDALDAIGLPKSAIKAILDGLDEVIGADQLRLVLDNVLTPGVVATFKAADGVFDAAAVIVDLAKDFSDHAHLPMDERVVHAVADAAIRFGLDQGVEHAAQWATAAAAAALSGGSATLVGAAVGRVAGVVLSEVVKLGLGAIEGTVDVVEVIADGALGRYQMYKAGVEFAGDVIHGVIDVGSEVVDGFVDVGAGVVDIGSDLIGGAADVVGDVGGSVKSFLGW